MVKQATQIERGVSWTKASALPLVDKLQGVLPFAVMAGLLLILLYKGLFLGYVPVGADNLQLNLPWAASVKDLDIRNWYTADTIYQTYPWQLYFKEMTDRGELPLWNPYSFGGYPLLANSLSGFLDPFNVLFLVFNFKVAYNLVLFLQLYSAGVFTYLFLRSSIGLGRFGSLVGGTLYMLNGVFIVWLPWGWMVGGAMWLPLVLLLLDKAWANRRHFYAILAGTALAGSFLGGMVQQSLALVLTVLLYVSIKSFLQYRKDRDWRFLLNTSLSIIVITLAAALALAAVQLIPTFELLAHSSRDFSLATLSQWFRMLPGSFFFSMALLVDFVNPYWTGNVQSLDFRTFLNWGAFNGNIIEFQGYVGIVALVLAGIAIFFRRSQHTSVFLCLALLTLLFAFATPLNILLYNRGLFVYTFSVAVLAGIGADYLSSSEEARGSLLRVNKLLSRLLAAFIGALLIGNAFLFILGDWIHRLGREYLQTRIDSYLPYTSNVEYLYGRLDSLFRNYLITSSSMYLPALIMSALIVIFAMYRRRIISVSIFRSASFSLVAIELLYFGITFTPFVREEDVFPETRVTTFLKEEKGVYRVLPVRDIEQDPPIMTPNTHVAYGIQSVGGYDSFLPNRYAELMGIIQKRGTESTRQSLSDGVFLSNYDSKLLDMLNTKYLLVNPEREINNSKFQKAFDGELSVYENKDALPRAFVVPRARVIRDKQELLHTLASDEFDPREEVLLEVFPQRNVSLHNLAGRATVEVASYSPHRVLIKAQLEEDAFLVLGDSYYPGWKAFVNSKETLIYRANYVLRAVLLPKGENSVEFFYDPWSFKIGRWISLSTFLVFLGMFVVIGIRNILRRFSYGRRYEAK